MNSRTDPQNIFSYFRREWFPLTIVTVSGLLYNCGLLAGHWFEGKLAQCLLNVLDGSRTFRDMALLCLAYTAVTAFVQGSRYVKRLYVRKFANNVSRSMKEVLYRSLVHKSRKQLLSENVGSLMTKAITDVDACAEGMRKFTTEIFDTGVALLGYVILLMVYDVRLALLCMIFPPFSYLIAEKMKTVVQRTGAAFKESAGQLQAASLDRISGAVTYRVFGCEEQRNQAYEEHLKDYEQKAVEAGIWVSAMPPLYQIISMSGVIFILYFGSRNICGTGWRVWDIAAFTTFLACYSKLSVKSSKAAKLFNSVQKAQVSWKRIKPLMVRVEHKEPAKYLPVQSLDAVHLGFSWPGQKPLFQDLNFHAESGQIIGITGPVACGKSSFGKLFLNEETYTGSLQYNGKEISAYTDDGICGITAYLGHDSELLSDTIENNLRMGEEMDVNLWLSMVQMDQECAETENGIHTRIGSGGIRLSGGQGQRLALARTLAHAKPLLILDDPFSALDRRTEEAIFQELQKMRDGHIILLISHRLYLFPKMDQILWMEDGKAYTSTHTELMKNNEKYRDLYLLQEKGEAHEEA